MSCITRTLIVLNLIYLLINKNLVSEWASCFVHSQKNNNNNLKNKTFGSVSPMKLTKLWVIVWKLNSEERKGGNIPQNVREKRDQVQCKGFVCVCACWVKSIAIWLCCLGFLIFNKQQHTHFLSFPFLS